MARKSSCWSVQLLLLWTITLAITQVATKCNLENWSLEQRVQHSQLVFTAVIHSVWSPTGQNNDTWSSVGYDVSNAIKEDIDTLVLNVRVKRVIKGSRRLEDQLVQVEGFNDRLLCQVSRVRLRDTRIFLVNYTPTMLRPPVRVRLNSSLVPMTLRNLQRIRSYTRGTVQLPLLQPPFKIYLPYHCLIIILFWLLITYTWSPIVL